MRAPILFTLPLLLTSFSGTAIAQETTSESSCGSLMLAISEIQSALDDGDLEIARDRAEQAKRDFMCQEAPINNLILVSVLHLSGAAHLYIGNDDAAWNDFGFSASAAPLATINPVLGARATETHEVLRQSVLAAPAGRIQMEGTAEIWLDGASIQTGVPLDVTAGQHLIQWRQEGMPMQNRIYRVESGELRAIPVSSDAGDIIEEGLTGTGDLTPRHYAMIGGGASLATSGLLFYLASSTKAEFDSTTDPTELDSLKSRYNGLIIGSALTGALGVAGLSGAFIFMDSESTHVQLNWAW